MNEQAEHAKQLRQRKISRTLTPVLLVALTAMAGNTVAWAAQHHSVHMIVVGGVVGLIAAALMLLRWWDRWWI